MARYDEDASVGFLGAPLLGETRTDAAVLASVDVGPSPGSAHWVFDAQGYAVTEECGAVPPDRVWLSAVRLEAPAFEAPPPATRPLRLLDAAGAPVAGAKVRIERRRSGVWGETGPDGVLGSAWASGSFGSSGARPPPAGREPPFLLLVEGWSTRVIRPEGTGPIEVRYPSGALDFQVETEAGEALEFAVVLDGLPCGKAEGSLLLRGVEPGRRTLIVGTATHGARLLEVDLPAQARRGSSCGCRGRSELRLPREE